MKLHHEPFCIMIYDEATDAATIKPNGRCKVKLRLDNVCNTCTCKTSASTHVLHDTHTLPLHAIQHRLQHIYRTHKNAFWTSTTSQIREAQPNSTHYSI